MFPAVNMTWRRIRQISWLVKLAVGHWSVTSKRNGSPSSPSGNIFEPVLWCYPQVQFCSYVHGWPEADRVFGRNVWPHFIIYVFNYLLTYSMVQSPSWEANWFAASQEIPRISRNPKVHYRIHKRPPPVPILSQIDPVHTTTSHFLNIHLNITFPFSTGSPKWSLSLRFPQQNHV